MCKFIFYSINNVLNENIIILCFVIILLSLKGQNSKKKYKEKIIRIKKPKKKKKLNVDNNEENVHEKIILQDAEHDDNIDLDGVHQPK